MGSNLGTAPLFEPPTDEDIKAAWSVVARLDVRGEVTGAGRSVARCVFAIEQMRAALGIYRPDKQAWSFPPKEKT